MLTIAESHKIILLILELGKNVHSQPRLHKTLSKFHKKTQNSNQIQQNILQYLQS